MSHPIAFSPLAPAAGLHFWGTKITHLFAECGRKKHSPTRTPKTTILIGRSGKCDIPVPDRFASHRHAMVRRRDDGLWEILDHGSYNGTKVNGKPIDEPVVLYVGMRVRIADTLLVATNEMGRIPITAYTIDEYCHQLNEAYGNSCEASRRIGEDEVGREFIRIHAVDWRGRKPSE